MRSLRLLITMLSLSVGLFAADNPFTGTWTNNPSKSHSIPPHPKSSTARIDGDEQNFKLNQEFVDDKGQKATSSFEAKFDAKIIR